MEDKPGWMNRVLEDIKKNTLEYKLKEARNAILDELEKWVGRTSFSPYMKEVVTDKLRSMREVKEE